MKGYIVLTFEFKKEGNKWTGYCDELGTATFGPSLLEARKRLEEAVSLHLNTLEDVGERERFLKENNIHFYRRKPKKKEIAIPADDRKIFIQPHIQSIRSLVAT